MNTTKKAKTKMNKESSTLSFRYLIQRRRPISSPYFQDKKFAPYFNSYLIATEADVVALQEEQSEKHWQYDYRAYRLDEVLQPVRYFEDYWFPYTANDLPILTACLRDYLEEKMAQSLEFAFKQCPKRVSTDAQKERRMKHEAIVENYRENLGEWQGKVERYRAAGKYKTYKVEENRSFLSLDEYFTYKTLMK